MSVGADAEKFPSPALLLLVGAFAGLLSFMVAIPAASMNAVTAPSEPSRPAARVRDHLQPSQTMFATRLRCARFPGGRACSAIGGALPLLRTIGPVGGPGRAP